jgi:ribosomal protein L24E
MLRRGSESKMKIPALVFGRVYLIRNTVNGKIYVGQTRQPLEKRWTDHRHEARQGDGCPLLYPALRKYGFAAFRIEALAAASSQSELDRLEKFYIEVLGCSDKRRGYNLHPGGYPALRFGIAHTEDTRTKMREHSFQGSKTHCPQGHPYDTENTYSYVLKDGTVARACRLCRREAVKQWQQRNPRDYRKPQCNQGHPFTPGNTYVRPEDGRRFCRICLAARTEAQQPERARREQAAAASVPVSNLGLFHNASKIRCPQGHLYDEFNTYWYIDKVGHRMRQCRTCRQARNHVR